MNVPSKQSPDKMIRKSLLTGLLITALLLFAKWCAEHTALYQGMQRASYGWLQSKLRPPCRRSDLPVIVLDIRDLEYTTIEVQGEKFPLTPRKPLMELIETVVAQKPKVIGVDIDFSPNKFGYGDPDDPKHFRRLLELRQQTGVPIFLGINRSQAKRRQVWLGSPEFESLAANIDNPDDNRKMFEWTGATGAEVSEAGASVEKGLTMCKALKNAVSPTENQPSKVASWVVSQVSEGQTERGLSAGEFLVDFSALDALRDTRLKTINPAVVKDQGWTLAGKAVLIGDGTLYEARDSVIVPLPAEKAPVPGIYQHASAAYTLIKAPLYELTVLARLLADFLLALVVLISVISARVYIQNRREKFAETRATYIFIFAVTVPAVLFGIVFVHKTRVIWDDFLFVILALWIHPAVDHTLWQALRSLRTNIPLILRRLFAQ